MLTVENKFQPPSIFSNEPKATFVVDRNSTPLYNKRCPKINLKVTIGKNFYTQVYTGHSLLYFS